MEEDRKEILDLIEQACQQGARKRAACELLGISIRTVQRWETSHSLRDGRIDADKKPSNKLSDCERQKILDIVNHPKYASFPPSKIVPLLADEGRYIVSEATIYRILKKEGQLAHGQSSRPASGSNKPKALAATKPNEIYSWDITYLPTATKGIFFYLYLVVDIFSRKIVGWQVHDCESGDYAANLMEDICYREGIERNQVTIHSDNGSPMKGATLLATLQQLGIVPSFSRPSVSNDNPYSESLFKTLKYRPEYPLSPFGSLEQARDWVAGFVHWYNEEHLHSGIKFVTPAQRHAGEDNQILLNRHKVYQNAKEKNPQRWSGKTRNRNPIEEVLLNPEKSNSKQRARAHEAAQPIT